MGQLHKRGFDIFRYSSILNQKIPCEYAYLTPDNMLVVRLEKHHLTTQEAIWFAEWLLNELDRG